MDTEPGLIGSLRKAVAALPDDLGLRLHLAAQLLAAGQRAEAVSQLGAVLQADPGNATALAMVADLGAQPAAEPRPAVDSAPPVQDGPAPRPADDDPGTARPVPALEPLTGGGPPGSEPDQPRPAGFDWARAEADLGAVLPPMFVAADGSAAGPQEPGSGPGRAPLRLADVPGLTEVKERLEAAFLAPMRNPELRRLYGKSLRGGLLLYGPPGCGKTFVAGALAAELGASFVTVSFADVIDMYTGQSERNIKKLFATARSGAPAVLFLDEIDALGQRRSHLRSAPIRSAVNQLLLELDAVTGGNDGVFVLAATNHPWDVDSALRRPGRLDRTLLVLPPDPAAREAVFRFHLSGRPVAGIELAALARLTDGYSAADIAHICESAAELALLDSVRTGSARMIGQDDLVAAAGQVRPSLWPWFDSARNVARYAGEGGGYDELAAYLKQHKLL
jgi:ATPase family associated with various cellular activities (AAA)/AAA+ lid domain/Tetratricopeptide repeat